MHLAREWVERSACSVGRVDHRGRQATKATATAFCHGASPLFSVAPLSTSLHTVLLPTCLLILGESEFQLLLPLNFSLLTIIGVSKLELRIKALTLTAGFC